MNNYNVILLVLSVIMISCLNRQKQKGNEISDTLKTKQDSIKQNGLDNNTFVLNGVAFEEKNNKIGDGQLNSFNAGVLCDKGFVRLDSNELLDEYNLFRNCITYFTYRGPLNQQYDDSSFVKSIYKLSMNVDENFYKMEKLVFKEHIKMKINEYGDCVVSVFEYLTPTSATQNKPIILFNLKKNEVVIMNFSEYSIRKGQLALSFQIRNHKRTWYTAKYVDVVSEFIPVCYKSVGQ